MDNRHSDFLRLFWTEIAVFLAENSHASFIPCINTAQDFHQRAFPCSIFPQQRHNFTGTKLKMDMIERFNSRKAFTDTIH